MTFISNFLFTAFFMFPGWQALDVVHDGIYSTGISPVTANLSDNTPVVAYSTGDGGPYGYHNTVYVKKWNGNNWEQLGSYLDTGLYRDTNRPSIAVDSQDNIFVAFYENTRVNRGPFIVRVKQWDGTNWNLLGTVVNNDTTQSALSPSLVIDNNDRPVVAFSEYSPTDSSNNIYVKRWDGSQWQKIGDTVEPDPSLSASSPSLITNNVGNPFVAFRYDNEIISSRWKGRQWVQNGLPLNIDEDAGAYGASLSKGTSGKIFISWHEQDDGRGGFAVNAAEWSRLSGWSRLGTPVNDGQNIMRAHSASLTVRDKSVPIVSWKDFDSDDLYVSYFSQRQTRWISYNRDSLADLFGVYSDVSFQDGVLRVVFTDPSKETLMLER